MDLTAHTILDDKGKFEEAVAGVGNHFGGNTISQNYLKWLGQGKVFEDFEKIPGGRSKIFALQKRVEIHKVNRKNFSEQIKMKVPVSFPNFLKGKQYPVCKNVVFPEDEDEVPEIQIPAQVEEEFWKESLQDASRKTAEMLTKISSGALSQVECVALVGEYGNSPILRKTITDISKSNGCQN